jgi:regulator of RNase E activity RraB
MKNKSFTYDEKSVESAFLAKECGRVFWVGQELSDTKPIEISKETYDKILSLRDALKKILRKNVSIDAVLKTLLTIDNTDGVITGLSKYLREESIDKDMKEESMDKDMKE